MKFASDEVLEILRSLITSPNVHEIKSLTHNTVTIVVYERDEVLRSLNTINGVSIIIEVKDAIRNQWLTPDEKD